MKKIILPILFVLFAFQLFSQSIVSLNSGKIVELESVQSAATNTLVTVCMERTNSLEKAVLYRSDDLGVTWASVYTIEQSGNGFNIVDPVIAVDEVGNMYVVVMRIDNINNQMFADLELYKSTDDGIALGTAYPIHLARL